MATIRESLALGARYLQTGQWQAAEQIYRQILAVDPNHVDALHLLGAVCSQLGQHEAAIEHISRAIQLKGSEALFHFNLGNAFHGLGRLQEAADSFHQAIELKPDYFKAYNNLGNVLTQQANLDEAITCYRRALAIKPDFVEGYSNLGTALKDQGKLDDAIAAYREAIRLKPDLAEVHSNLGIVHMDLGQREQAIESYRRALELNPNIAKAHNNLGNALKEQGRLDDAVACYRTAIQLQPDFVEVYSNLGTALKDQGKLDEAIESYRRALQLSPAYNNARSNLLCAIQYGSDITLSKLAALHAEFERFHAAKYRAVWPQWTNDRDPDRRLRIGFISPDFGRHPVGFLSIRAFENLDRDQFEIILYNGRLKQDDYSARFRAVAAMWRDIYGVGDDELTRQILDDRIDILVDLAGHTAGNRLPVFARKPAPIQITWLGYEGTTGLEAIDYLIADTYTVPTENEFAYRERILRMPNGYVCYEPLPQAPDVGPLPALQNGFIRFGSFNNLSKVTSQVCKAWSKILHQVPGSKLVLKYHGLADPSVRHHYLDLFASAGVDLGRLELEPPSDHAAYLAAYGSIDIALDPFPFGGGVTTCDALWMGAPVITVPRETFASRHSLSHISNAGLTGTIARDLDEYIDLAVDLANDLPRLAKLRSELRPRMSTSLLCDGKRFAQDLAKILRQAWRAWVVSG